MKRNNQRRTRKKRQRMVMLTVVAWIGFGAALALMVHFRSAESDGAATVSVVAAELSEAGKQGEAAYNANCADCHGESAAGTKTGPPLIHDIYNPGHHSDQAFYLAAANGVRAHHWNYGDMPAQPQVSREEVTAIIRYIRELQEANGIFYEAY